MAMKVPVDPDRRNVSDSDITIPTNDPLPAVALGVLAVAFFAAGVALIVLAFWSTWEFWPRVGLGLLGSYTLACAVTLIATRSGEISGQPRGEMFRDAHAT